MALLQQRCLITGLPSAFPLPARKRFVCRAQKPEVEKEPVVASKLSKIGGAAVAGLAASILLATSAFPEDALAARSGGRTGGSSFRSSAPRAGPTVTNRSYNYNISPAPPVYGGFGGFGGYGYGYGGGGISIMPTFITPVGGGIFQLMFLVIAASTIVSIARAAFSKRRDNSDNWDD